MTTVDHEEVFRKTKDLLAKHVNIKVDNLEYGSHLTIDQTGIWIESDPNELTIGYGMAHTHYNPKYDNLANAMERLFNLLTRRKRITLYSKGGKIFKEKIEIELEGSKFQHIGTAMTWAFPFWKKTTTEIIIEPPLIEHHRIENEIKDICELLR